MVKWQRLTTGPPITAQRGGRWDRGGHRMCRNTEDGYHPVHAWGIGRGGQRGGSWQGLNEQVAS